MFVAASFIIVENFSNLFFNRKIVKLWHIQTIKHYKQFKINNLELHLLLWIKITMLSEESWTKTLYSFYFTYLKKEDHSI